MAFPRKDLFSTKDQRLSAYASAFCHPARIFILRHLQETGGLFVHEIERLVPLSRGAVSDHLNVLREVHLVNVAVEGRYNFYTVDLQTLKEILTEYTTLMEQLCADSPGDVLHQTA